MKLAVALSGGVDSSVACALLKKQGFIVIGLHMKLFPGKIEKRVKEIGKVLDIPIKIIDYQKEFAAKMQTVLRNISTNIM